MIGDMARDNFKEKEKEMAEDEVGKNACDSGVEMRTV